MIGRFGDDEEDKSIKAMNDDHWGANSSSIALASDETSAQHEEPVPAVNLGHPHRNKNRKMLMLDNGNYEASENFPHSQTATDNNSIMVSGTCQVCDAFVYSMAY
jgi:hypothetical protein